MSNSPSTETLGEPSHQDLVRAAVLAPSPDNNQPWRFVSTEGALEVCLDRERSLPSDVNAMYDLMSIGAGIENLSIQAREAGFQTDVKLLADLPLPAPNGRDARIATVEFRPGAAPDPLHKCLATRCTNRKLFSSRTVDPNQLEAVSKAIHAFPEVQLNWLIDRKIINTLARLIAQSDRFRFEYQPFHGEIFRQLRFSAEEANRTRDGLDFRTLEMPPGSSIMIRGLRSWHVMQWVNRLGLGRLLTAPSWLSVRKCGAIGAISIPAASVEGFVTGGRAFQRIWLSSESQGLALHPLGSLPIFIGQMEQLGGRNLHRVHQTLSKKLNDWFRQLVPDTQGRTLLMLFRVGYAQRPHIQSLRRPAEEVFEIGGGR
ncbi:MAG: hypothetical protein ACYC3X_27965 [Pirellulaceae bacterium]